LESLWARRYLGARDETLEDPLNVAEACFCGSFHHSQRLGFHFQQPVGTRRVVESVGIIWAHSNRLLELLGGFILVANDMRPIRKIWRKDKERIK
jgi:hypothetical protein